MKLLLIFLFRISDSVEPHGLMAGWFLTWFVHEFPNLEDSMQILDFQLSELSVSDSHETADISIAAAMILLYKNKLMNWRDDPFERIMFLRNLPKIASAAKVIECTRLLKEAKIGKDVFIIQAWTIFIVLLFVADKLSGS